MTCKELTIAFNLEFGLNKPESSINAALGNRGIISGRTGCFEKGQIPWNKGVKGYMGANRTSFKKGSVPPNRKPLWDERIDSKDGCILMKVPETDPYTGFPTRYKHKHVWTWEQANGPVPAGHVVAFRDGDKLNCDLENLMCIHRNELLLLNLHKYWEQPEEVRPSIMALVKLEATAGIRTTGRVPGAGRKKKLQEQL